MVGAAEENHNTEPELHILVLDQDSVICDLISYNLENEGCAVTVCADAMSALELNLTSFSLIISETGPIGSIDGKDFVTKIKTNPETAALPVIFCSNADSEDDIIDGFNVGADDYILKPFSLREMIARIKAVIRRHRMVRGREAMSAGVEATLSVIRFDNLVIDIAGHSVCIDGENVNFSRTEFQLLSLFARNPGKLFSRSEIMGSLRPERDTGSARMIDVTISRLRKKMAGYASMLVSKSGQGYGLITNQ